jgi:hypothetical protein
MSQVPYRPSVMDAKPLFKYRLLKPVIINDHWITNIIRNNKENKDMFKRMRKWITKEADNNHSALLTRFENLIKIHKSEIAEIAEDLFIHRKMTNVPEHKTIHGHKYWDSDNIHNKTIQESMELDRQKAIKEGFSHIHTRADGDEVWAKMPPKSENVV